MILHDNSTNGGSTTGTSLTFAHTCTGENRALVVAISVPAADNVNHISGVTYGGQAMTLVGPSYTGPGTGQLTSFILINPPSGANNVVITLLDSQPVYAASASYTGVKQTGQPAQDNNTATDPNTTASVSVTTTDNNAWLISCASRKTGSSATISAGANTTARQVNSFIAIGDSNGPQSPAGSFSQTWNISASTGLAIIVASLEPAPEVESSYAFFM